MEVYYISLDDVWEQLNSALQKHSLPRLESDDYGRAGKLILKETATFNWWLKKCPAEIEKVFPGDKAHIGYRKPISEIRLLKLENERTVITHDDACKLCEWFLHYAPNKDWPVEIINLSSDPEFQEYYQTLTGAH